jgi:hypothetical protein
MQNFNLPALGAGVGLRNEHFHEIIDTNPECAWFEVIIENVMGLGGFVGDSFDRIRSKYRIIPHGVCMSIGSTDPLDRSFLLQLRDFLRSIDAPWMSDHLCFTMVDHINLSELIPLPFTDEAVKNVVERIKVVQDILEVPFLVENVTRYMTVSDREMSEAEFITRILEEADCGLLLDVTNVYINSRHHSFEPLEFMRSLPLERVGQMHLAGWEDDGETLIDSHDAPVPETVWQLFKNIIPQVGPTSVLIEWDANLPRFDRLIQEADLAQAVLNDITNNEELKDGASSNAFRA